MSTLGALKSRSLLIIMGLAASGFGYRFVKQSAALPNFASIRKEERLTKTKISEALKKLPGTGQFPATMELDLPSGEKSQVQLQYSFDAKLQKTMEDLLKSYAPD